MLPPSFFQATNPRLLPNQQAVVLLADLLAVKNSWVYVCWPTGTGKTTQMLELGYIMGKALRSSNGKAVVNVRLIVPSSEQAKLYKKRFEEK